MRVWSIVLSAVDCLTMTHILSVTIVQMQSAIIGAKDIRKIHSKTSRVESEDFMSGDMMFGKCRCCGKEKPLAKTVFRYPIKCECHSPTHFISIEHCKDCIPKEPTYTKVEFKTEDLKNPVAMAMKVVKTEISKDKSETLQAKAKRLIELVNNPYCLGPVALLEGAKEVIPALIAENMLLQIQPIEAQQQEIDNLKRQLSCERQTVNMLKSFGLHYSEFPKIEADELIDKLTADKDEQAGRIMRMEDALRQTKTAINDLMACNEISKIADVRGEEAIRAIDALLGGKENAKE